MGGFRQGLNQTWNFVSSLARKAADQAESRKLGEFKLKVKLVNDDVLKITHTYKHKITCRWFSLIKMEVLLEDFQDLTNSFGEHFAIESSLKAWITCYNNMCDLIVSIVNDDEVEQDDEPESIEVNVALCGTSLKLLLEIRYKLILVTYLALKWTRFCRSNEYDLQIFLKALPPAHLIDDAVEQGVNRLMSIDYQLNFYMMSKRRALDIINSINEHKEGLGCRQRDLLLSLRDRLTNVVPGHKTVLPPKSSITFAEFHNPHFYKI